MGSSIRLGRLRVKDLIYAAATIDCEGCIFVYWSGSKNPLPLAGITVVNTDSVLTDWLYNTFGGNIRLQRRNNPKHKDAFHWCLQRKKQVNQVLVQILPHLKLKREQAELAIQINSTSAHDGYIRMPLADKLYALNRRGL